MTPEADLPEKRFSALLSLLKVARENDQKKQILDTVSAEFSPWEIAHYLYMTSDTEGANILWSALDLCEPGTAFRVNSLLRAARWRDEFNQDLVRDFGSQ